MDYTEFYKDLSAASVFDSIIPAEPVSESLPHRGTAYEATGISRNNPLLDYVSPDPNRYTPEMSVDDANLLAEYEVDMILGQLDLFVELGKGGISEFLVSKRDLQLLADYQLNAKLVNEEVIREILSRIEIKNEFEKNKTGDVSQERNLLIKLAKNDNLKKRANGTLKMPSLQEAGMQMFMNRVMKLSGNNPKIFGILGRNFIQKVIG